MKKAIIDSFMYVLILAAIQIAVGTVTTFISQTADVTPMVTTLCSVISSVLTIALFAWRKWTPMSGQYINQRQWFTQFWVICLALGSALPMTFFTEQVGLELPPDYTKLFKGMINSDLGFLALAILAPIAEEMVFRGAILRRMLDAFDTRWHWAAIVITSARLCPKRLS